MLLDKLIEKYDVDPLNGEEVVHMTQHEYNRLVEIAKTIHKNTEDMSNMNFRVQFNNQLDFPTVESLISHDIENNLREFLPYIIFYRVIPFPSLVNNEEYINTLKYIEKLFVYHFDLIEDKDMLPLQITKAALWKKMKKEEKMDLLRPIVSYYGTNEFVAFLKDLKWMDFMESYKFKETEQRRYDYPEQMFKELKRLFDDIQEE